MPKATPINTTPIRRRLPDTPNDKEAVDTWLSFDVPPPVDTLNGVREILGHLASSPHQIDAAALWAVEELVVRVHRELLAGWNACRAAWRAEREART